MLCPFWGIALFSCFSKKIVLMAFDFMHELLKLEKLVNWCLVILIAFHAYENLFVLLLF